MTMPGGIAKIKSLKPEIPDILRTKKSLSVRGKAFRKRADGREFIGMTKKALSILFVGLMVLLTAMSVSGCGRLAEEKLPEAEEKAGEASSNNGEPLGARGYATPSSDSSGGRGETESRLYEKDEIKIRYPQFNRSADSAWEAKINELIRREAMKGADYFEGAEGKVHVEVDYKIALQTQEQLSLIFSGLGYVEDAAYPINLFYTLNLDLASGTRLRLTDLVRVDEAFAKYFAEGGFEPVNTELEPHYRDYFSGVSVKEWVQRLLNADPEDIRDGTFSYLTKDSLGISISLIHAMGDHGEFEARLEAIKDFLQ